ncbi:hypothetical protein A6A08_08650 [Nocardiopsis sp. TSRI0078]|uniref:hypothetical protein n=1 Tax=unclassified Nocardiopsis TaxID=2649073 RepID=UPI00093E10A8|nr:hypothetical protein [Nocardiopsis sp. TSRI0078]OKI15636.1 hypothetical protein A6A08_08650 [Nocardiopsis sp. TSRI0078]
MQRARPRPRPRIRRGHLYDAVAALIRAGTGWVFAGHGLALRGREAPVAEHLSVLGPGTAALVAAVVPVLLVWFSLAFAVGLLTWLTGPVLGAGAVLGALATDAPGLAPFSSWATTMLVTAVCVLMAVHSGRWSWDHLALSPRGRGWRRRRGGGPLGTEEKDPAVSPRLPEHAPPLLYPVGQAALRRPYRL